jgi:hypothetical protein
MRDPGEFLTTAEVRKAAGGAKSVAEQARVLKTLGLPHQVVNGVILVSRYHLREWLAGKVVAPSTKPRMELVT